MINNVKKEFLLVEENPDNVLLFFSFFKKCDLVDKLIHAWSDEDATGILLFEDISNLELIIIGPKHSSSTQVDLINDIRNNDVLVHVPIVVLTSSKGNEAIFKMRNIVVIELVSNPLDFQKFKIILAVAGYTFDDLLE